MDPQYPPPLVYRVLRKAVQRVPPTVQSLNSHAAYLILREKKRQLLLWVGVYCEEDNEEFADTVVKDVVENHFSCPIDAAKVVIVTETQEPTHVLDIICDLLWTNRQHYSEMMQSRLRQSKQNNSSISVGFIEKIFTDDGREMWSFEETCFGHPDEDGTVPKIPFVPTEPTTIAFVNTGDVWEIWYGREVSAEDRNATKSFVEAAITAELNLDGNDFREEILAQLVHVVEQHQESVLFRYAFKMFPDSLVAPYRPPEHVPTKEEWMRRKKAYAENRAIELSLKREAKELQEEEQTEEVGEAPDDYLYCAGAADDDQDHNINTSEGLIDATYCNDDDDDIAAKQSTSKGLQIMSVEKAKSLHAQLLRLGGASAEGKDEYNADDTSYATEDHVASGQDRCCSIS